MNVHHIDKTNFVFKMSSKNPPRLSVRSGDIVVVDALDGFGESMKSDYDLFPKIDMDRVNPATGPIYVEEAKPGDSLVIDILSIEVTGSTGVTTIIPNFGPLQNDFTRAYKKVMPVRGGFVYFPKGIRIPVRPVIGTIGVAPGGGEEVTTLYPGQHGGNLDVSDITSGSRVYFPVFAEGALLSLGDVKAAMADGESNGTGIEVSIRATLKLSVEAGKSISRPRVETKDSIMMLAMDKTLEGATKLALKDMIDFLKNETALTSEEAYVLIGAACDVRIGNVVDPLVTVRVILPKSILIQADKK